MKLENLSPKEGSKRRKRRVGRGIAAGQGASCGFGMRGQKSRSGKGTKAGFEGGQMPLQRRVPKFGFTNINRKEYSGINLNKLQELVDKGIVKNEVTLDALVENRLARKNDLVKILGGGELKASLKISVHKFTATAKAAIEAAGGEAINL